jgi:hypothetical protein
VGKLFGLVQSYRCLKDIYKRQQYRDPETVHLSLEVPLPCVGVKGKDFIRIFARKFAAGKIRFIRRG